jgi:hypothetical protein
VTILKRELNGSFHCPEEFEHFTMEPEKRKKTHQESEKEITVEVLHWIYFSFYLT